MAQESLTTRQQVKLQVDAALRRCMNMEPNPNSATTIDHLNPVKVAALAGSLAAPRVAHLATEHVRQIENAMDGTHVADLITGDGIVAEGKSAQGIASAELRYEGGVDYAAIARQQRVQQQPLPPESYFAAALQ